MTRLVPSLIFPFTSQNKFVADVILLKSLSEKPTISTTLISIPFSNKIAEPKSIFSNFCIESLKFIGKTNILSSNTEPFTRSISVPITFLITI